MKYTKPHLSFEEQLDQLRGRGMQCAYPDRAVHTLRRLGYYRFSAYAYPFRHLLANGTPRETSVQYRADTFVEGTTFEGIEALAAFDRGLRLLCLDALEAIELSLRVQLAYGLGARSTFGHLDIDALDSEACQRPSPDEGLSVYESWLQRYNHLQNDAHSEDFVTHYVEKYDARLPIWVAIEVMDFGSLVRLFGLLKHADQNNIGRALGVPNGRLLARMLKTLNYLRNVSAHHGRLWNRNLTYQMPGLPQGQIDPLSHLSVMTPSARKRIYASLALLNYLLTANHPQLDWRERILAHLTTFPVLEKVSMGVDMGFPDDWAELAIWKL